MQEIYKRETAYSNEEVYLFASILSVTEDVNLCEKGLIALYTGDVDDICRLC